MSSGDHKRVRLADSPAGKPTAASTASAVEGYTYDSASGWYVSDVDPSWSYNSGDGLFYNSASHQFYRQDVTTGEFTTVVEGGGGGGGAAAPTAQAEEIPKGLGNGPLLPHIADYTFMQGRRPTQEDRHTMLPKFGTQHLKKLGGDVTASFYAVFDGHTGDKCSDFMAKNLHKYIAKELVKNVGTPLTTELVEAAIVQACSAVDKEFLRIAKIRKARDGCCCIAALILGSTVFIVNIGDSRAVIATKKVAAALSDDHKPERPSEKARVEAAGGMVLKYGDCWRVTTPEALEWEKLPAFKKNAVARPVQPAVARSFGDLTLKAPRLLLSSEPEITVREMGADDTLLLLGCDGIWDVLTDQDAVDAAFAVEPAEPKAMAGTVVKLAYDSGSQDNISVVAICLHRSTMLTTTAAEEGEKGRGKPPTAEE